ncbi:type II toxin-antitoxin system RelE/ParE family toxin [Asticcacaulis sp. BYS171W]|uniref:Type II toxin-antitoxin system RelE/ParE family toxin n=1 Tax=Asticcacaulis aquaticus TaxID=2984212 RepID=A0ABT5HSI3_9CAUL|nr:type II toxin-antitoxin system RelE/ParE family toxin [Asticcacaulis aquaticus]MDC7683025.1 type II toxin-antitoxin system RelE/ParE family toxin [Asticcacaulis aquaticus]
MPVVRKRESARRDLVEHFVYLAEEAGMATADRFLENAETTFAELAEFPASGRRLDLEAAILKDMRVWRIKDFENWRVFYIPEANGVSIVRVLHASREWWAILSD